MTYDEQWIALIVTRQQCQICSFRNSLDIEPFFDTGLRYCMSGYLDRDSGEQLDDDRQWFKDVAPTFFLGDVFLMFSTLIFDNIESLWIYAIFQLVVTGYGLFVLHMAQKAAKIIPPSIPFQRPIGLFLYISYHLLQFNFPGQVPLYLTAYMLLAAPLAWMFLFEE